MLAAIAGAIITNTETARPTIIKDGANITKVGKRTLILVGTGGELNSEMDEITFILYFKLLNYKVTIL